MVGTLTKYDINVDENDLNVCMVKWTSIYLIEINELIKLIFCSSFKNKIGYFKKASIKTHWSHVC